MSSNATIEAASTVAGVVEPKPSAASAPLSEVKPAAIAVRGVSKHYHIYEKPQDRLKPQSSAPIFALQRAGSVS